MNSPLALIGLGLVGKALISRLLPAGYTVIGFDISDAARADAQALGAPLAASAREAAGQCDVVLLSLPNSEIVCRLLWEEGLAEALQPGAWVLDTTTGWPAHARENARRLAERGVGFADVTLSGSSEDIARGEATALVGAEDPRGAGVSPVGGGSLPRQTGETPVLRPDLAALLTTLAGRVFYLGEPGAGCLAKLVTNHVMGLNRAALAEGLALGLKAGLSGETLLEVLRESAAYSRVLDMKGRRMVEGDFAPASRIAQHEKDVRLILRLAQELGARVPLEKVHGELLREAIEQGWGGQDNAALVRVFSE